MQICQKKGRKKKNVDSKMKDVKIRTDTNNKKRRRSKIQLTPMSKKQEPSQQMKQCKTPKYEPNPWASHRKVE